MWERSTWILLSALGAAGCFHATSLEPFGTRSEAGAEGGTSGNSGAAGHGGTLSGNPQPLPACVERSPGIGACVVAVDDAYAFDNEEPRSGTIASVDEIARPDCFGSGNWSNVLPNAPHEGQSPVVPPSTTWWHFLDDEGQGWVLGLAAPGLERLGVSPGDRVTVDWSVSRYGWEWGDGAAVITVRGRGRVIYALNEPAALGIEEGPNACTRSGACSGTEWILRFREGDTLVPGGAVASIGSWTFASGYAFTHSASYREPNEGVPEIPGCTGPATETFASGVVTDPATE